MSYVDRNLMDGEEVVYKGQLHWIIFAESVSLFAVGSVFIFIHDKDGYLLYLTWILWFMAGLSFLKSYINKLTTELAITTKRVIAKWGLIRRTTVELNHSKVESFNIDQSILARILGFGTLIINGTGGGKTPIPNVASPLTFRREAMQIIDATQ